MSKITILLRNSASVISFTNHISKLSFLYKVTLLSSCHDCVMTHSRHYDVWKIRFQRHNSPLFENYYQKLFKKWGTTHSLLYTIDRKTLMSEKILLTKLKICIDFLIWPFDLLPQNMNIQASWKIVLTQQSE